MAALMPLALSATREGEPPSQWEARLPADLYALAPLLPPVEWRHLRLRVALDHPAGASAADLVAGGYAKCLALVLMRGLLRERGPVLEAVVVVQQTSLSPENVALRVSTIPVRPDAKVGAEFFLHARAGGQPREVLAREFQLPAGQVERPFPPGAVVTVLGPGEAIAIRATVVEGDPENGAHVSSSHVGFFAVQGPHDATAVEPRRAGVRLTTAGQHHPPEELVRRRLRKMLELLRAMSEPAAEGRAGADGVFDVAIPPRDGAAGMGLLLARIAFVLDPAVGFVAPGSTDGVETVTIRAGSAALAAGAVAAAAAALVPVVTSLAEELVAAAGGAARAAPAPETAALETGSADGSSSDGSSSDGSSSDGSSSDGSSSDGSSSDGSASDAGAAGGGEALQDYAGGRYTRAEVAAIARVRGAPGAAVPRSAADLPADLAYRASPYKQMPRAAALHGHLGQRKLMLGEVQFLAEHGHRAPLVLYVGAAPGTHIPMLADLFPEHEFHLWDGREFSATVREHPRIKTFQKMFFEEQARAYEGKACLLISDIRAADPDDAKIVVDNEVQAAWVRQIRPAAFSLKFHPPYRNPTGRYRYLNGEARLQAWAPLNSSETRLFAVAPEDPAAPWPERDWDTAAYDAQMFYRNLVDRDWAEAAPGAGLEDAKGGDRCADCATERLIWDTYLATPWGRAGKKTAAALADRLSRGWPLRGLPGHNPAARLPGADGQWRERAREADKVRSAHARRDKSMRAEVARQDALGLVATPQQRAARLKRADRA